MQHFQCMRLVFTKSKSKTSSTLFCDDRLSIFQAATSYTHSHCYCCLSSSLCALLMRIHAKINDRTKICKRITRMKKKSRQQKQAKQKWKETTPMQMREKKTVYSFCIKNSNSNNRTREIRRMVQIKWKGGAFKILFMAIVNRYMYVYKTIVEKPFKHDKITL